MNTVKFCLLTFFVAIGVVLSGTFAYCADVDGTPIDYFTSRVENDWILQESHSERTISDPAALNDLVARLEKTIERLEEDELCDAAKIEALRAKIVETKSIDLEKTSDDERANAYRALRWQAREILFSNELFKDVPLVFIKGRYFGFQVLQEYLSCYARFANLGGGGVFLLKKPGFSFDADELTEDFPVGHYSTVNMSYDAKEIYFSYADFSDWYDRDATRMTMLELKNVHWYDNMEEYLAEPKGKYHLYKMNLETGETTQLTDGPYDDFDAVPAPDGSLVFMSTRRGGYARCTGWHEPIQVTTLHKLMSDGTVKCLSYHETNEWTPSFLRDGRIIYTRWDYVDRTASRYMALWWTNPDGSSPSILYGNYTEEVCLLIQAKQIPNSEKILFIAGGHHLGVGGSIVILDPTKIKYESDGFDTLDAIERVTPEIPFAETVIDPERAKDHFHVDVWDDKYYIPQQFYFSPYPFSEDFYFTSYSHEQLGGYLKDAGRTAESLYQGKLGLYYRDRFGNLELMFEDDDFDCRYPTPIQEREVPAQLSTKIPDADADSDYGTFNLVNVYDSIFEQPSDRKIKELRIYQLLPKFPLHNADNPKIGHDFAGNARMFLGTVPVDEDGSAYFKAPSRKPLYFQAVDEDGRAVQTMLSEVYLQPGENRGCVGCHEQLQSTADNADQRRTALNRAPSEILPGPKGTKPFSYPVLIQSILDRACVSCHDGGENSPQPALTGEKHEQRFTVSYQNLRPYIRWYEWLPENSIRRTVSFPGECGADASPLTEILQDENHKGKLELSEQDLRNIYLWLDSNIPFYGSYDPEDCERTLEGEEVEEPSFQ